MPSPNLPDFDALWDYSRPEQTETKFREILLQFPEDGPAFLELLTQIARAQGLQRKFEHAHQTLDQVERRLGEVASRPRIRYLLERGRVFNSSGEAEKARPYFDQALGYQNNSARILTPWMLSTCWRSSRRPSKTWP